ncbi:unnamed protein product [Macrosiphum euphorbiae]|uniref:Uncharacterized protein n=1 Tax=Macrosiphum euphorbiae TaxID=13131 RepID=A0AAV0W352_9HEMI|nr:unnamed protein product [Macrosiphum euphorbiae]
MRLITFVDYYHKQFDIPEDFTEFIDHVKKTIDITIYGNVTLVKEPDNEKLDTQDIPSTITSNKKTTGENKIEVIESKPEETDKNTASSKKKKIDTTIDNSVILPEKISKLYFNLYIKKNVLRLRLNTTFGKIDSAVVYRLILRRLICDMLLVDNPRW